MYPKVSTQQHCFNSTTLTSCSIKAVPRAETRIRVSAWNPSSSKLTLYPFKPIETPSNPMTTDKY
eukprot:758641-Hanusia_phi.AAC.2